MGSAGRAIGPDGKPLRNQEAKNNNKPKGSGGVQQRGGGGGGKSNRGNKEGNQRFGKGGNRFNEGRGGPRPLMAGGPLRHIGGGPMGGHQPMGMPMHRGPQPFDFPMQGMGMYNAPVPQPTGPDPTGSYGGFFGKLVSAGMMRQVPEPQQPKPQPTAVKPSTPLATVKAETLSGSHVGEVPGFGNNSNIHELFGKMVWKKMEQIRDEQVVDNLQSQIMKLIHDALAAQNLPGPSTSRIESLNRGAFLQPTRRY